MIKGRSTWFVQIRTSTRALRWRDHAQVLLKSATYVVASYFGAHQLARQQTRTMKTKRMKIVGDDLATDPHCGPSVINQDPAALLYSLKANDPDLLPLLETIGYRDAAAIFVRIGGNAGSVPNGLRKEFLLAADRADREILSLRSILLESKGSNGRRLIAWIPNYYADIAMPWGASHEAITFSFRKLSKAVHTDRLDMRFPIVEGFKDAHRRLNAAKVVLSDPIERSTYDRCLLAGGYHPSSIELPQKFWFYHPLLRKDLEPFVPRTLTRY